jgi:dipeptidase E
VCERFPWVPQYATFGQTKEYHMKIVLASETTGCFPAITSEGLDHARGRRLLYIPTASYGEGWEPDYERHIRPFESQGFSIRMFDLADKDSGSVDAALAGSDAVYVGGGNTFHLLRHMRQSGFFDLIGGYLASGVVYIGSSAGSVVATPDIAYAASVDDPSKGAGVLTGGLSLIDRPVLPHFDHPDFSVHVRRIADGFDAVGTPYFALNDDEALVVDGFGTRLVKSGRASVLTVGIAP